MHVAVRKPRRNLLLLAIAMLVAAALWAALALISVFLPGMLLAVAGFWLWREALRLHHASHEGFGAAAFPSLVGMLFSFLAGLLAQPALQTDAGKTIRYAVWQHGAAADQLQATRANWVVEDLADEIGDAR